MLSWPVRNMVRRSMPIPQPAVGGKPYSSDVQNVSSISCASSSPAAFCCKGHSVTRGCESTSKQPVRGEANRSLLGKALALHQRIVELSVGVGDLSRAEQAEQAQWLADINQSGKCELTSRPSTNSSKRSVRPGLLRWLSTTQAEHSSTVTNQIAWHRLTILRAGS